MKKRKTLGEGRLSINIKWKLTLWASFLLLFLFLTVNLVQYVIIQNWVLSQEKETIEKNMDEVIAYLRESSMPLDLEKTERYLEVLNEEYQMIRIVKEDDTPLVTVSDEVSDDEIEPKYVTEEEYMESTVSEELLLVYRQPVVNERFNGTVEIARNMESFDDLTDNLFTLMMVAGGVAIVLSIIGGRLISFQLLKPVKTIIQTMKRIKEHGLQERVPVKRHRDELTELSRMFNEMMDNLEGSFQQQQQFVEDASHELKTPLSIIHGHLSLINRWGRHEPEVLERSLQLSLNETDRLIQLVSELLVLSRNEKVRPVMDVASDVRIRPVIQNIIDNFKVIHRDATITSDLCVDENDVVTIGQRYLEQILVILLDNAINYSKEEKCIQIKAIKRQEQLILEVKDYGIGIPKEELPFILNRFYRVDKARSRKSGGNGLGLAIAKRLLDFYGGHIQIESEYGNWTKVTIILPMKERTSDE